MKTAHKVKPKPLTKWANAALKKIDKSFSPRERKHPFVVFTKLLVIAKECGIDVFKKTGEERHGHRKAAGRVQS